MTQNMQLSRQTLNLQRPSLIEIEFFLLSISACHRCFVTGCHRPHTASAPSQSLHTVENVEN